MPEAADRQRHAAILRGELLVRDRQIGGRFIEPLVEPGDQRTLRPALRRVAGHRAGRLHPPRDSTRHDALRVLPARGALQPGVAHVRSSIVLREIKSEVALPLGHLLGAKAGPSPSRR